MGSGNSRIFTFLFLALASVLHGLGCGGGTPDTSMPLSEARLLNSEVRVLFGGVQTFMATTQEEVASLTALPNGANPRNFDLNVMRTVAGACFSDPVQFPTRPIDTELPAPAEATPGPDTSPLLRRTTTGRANACRPAQLLTLETYVEALAPDAQRVVIQYLLLADRLRVNLHDVLPAHLEHLERFRGGAEREVERLRGRAEAALARAQDPKVHAEQRRRAEIEYEEVTTQLQEVDTILQDISRQLQGFRHLRRQLIDDAARNISRLGQS